MEQVLQLVAEGGAHSYQELMQRLSLSQPMLEALLEELTRLGYLQVVNSGCQGRCAGCPLGSCVAAGMGRMWTLTEKGHRAADRLGRT